MADQDDITSIGTPAAPGVPITARELRLLAEDDDVSVYGATSAELIREHEVRAVALRHMADEIDAAIERRQHGAPIVLRQVLAFVISEEDRPMSIALDIAGAGRLDEMVRAVNRALAADAAGRT